MNKVRIKELGKVVTGKTPPTKNPEYFGGNLPFLTPTDITEGRKFSSTAKTISDAGKLKFKSSLVPAGSTAFVCIASIGKISQTTADTLTNQQINTVIPHDKTDSDYLYYLLLNNRSYVKHIAGGTASPIVNKTTFENIQLQVHDLPGQIIIGKVLSSYDNLIDNNSLYV